MLNNNYKASFTSDNIAAASQEVMEAMIQANQSIAQPYGSDELTAACEARFKELFECNLKVLLVPTGTAANALCLAAATPPWGSVLCHEESHINNDECGAPEFYTNGAKLVNVAGENSKISAEHLQDKAGLKKGDVHSVQPSVVSITQATESGSLYSLEEISAIGRIAKAQELKLHMDGARFANALVSLGCTPAEMTWKAGVDLLSFGATKNGVMAAEAIIVFDLSLVKELEFRRKRAGQLFSKMRFMAAQMNAYLNDDLWLRNASHANAMAKKLADGLNRFPQIELLTEVETNILFCRLPELTIEALHSQGFSFYANRWGKGVCRFVTSFMTREEEVDDFLQAIAKLHSQ